MRDDLRAPVYAAAALLLIVSAVFLVQQNYEFLFYVAVLAVLGGIVIYSDKHIKWPQRVLWFLFGWGVLHLAGGAVIIDGHVLYAQMLIPIIGEPYLILKYDQVVHAYGYFVATIIMYNVLKTHLRTHAGPVVIGVTLFTAGLGLSAINEILEFFATVLVPETNVGGYVNTALDLCFNALGAGLAVAWLRIKGKI